MLPCPGRIYSITSLLCRWFKKWRSWGDANRTVSTSIFFTRLLAKVLLCRALAFICIVHEDACFASFLLYPSIMLALSLGRAFGFGLACCCIQLNYSLFIIDLPSESIFNPGKMLRPWAAFIFRKTTCSGFSPVIAGLHGFDQRLLCSVHGAGFRNLNFQVATIETEKRFCLKQGREIIHYCHLEDDTVLMPTVICALIHVDRATFWTLSFLHGNLL